MRVRVAGSFAGSDTLQISTTSLHRQNLESLSKNEPQSTGK